MEASTPCSASPATALQADAEDGAVPDDPLEALRCSMDHLQDAAYVRAMFTRFGMPTVLTLLDDLVGTGERSDVHAALLFSEYAIRFGLAGRDFAEAYIRSRLPGAIRQQVFAPDYTVRHLAVHAVMPLETIVAPGYGKGEW
jgi:hypothetical protein